LQSDEILLDLYCGTGTIGLTMANCCKTLVGVEIIEDAIKDANENAKNNGITKRPFYLFGRTKGNGRACKRGIET